MTKSRVTFYSLALLAAIIIVLPKHVSAAENLPSIPSGLIALPDANSDSEPPAIAAANLPSGNKTIAPTQASMGAVLNWHGSMMFKRKELDIIYAILDGVNVEEELLTNNSQNEVEVERTPLRRENIRITRLVPSYNLNSILYFNKNNWSFWLNGKKIDARSKARPNFKVIAVDQNTVTMTWRDPNLNDIVPDWKDYYIPYNSTNAAKKYNIGESWDYMSRDGTVLVNSTTGRAQFTLTPYQSFQTYTLSIIEGKSKSFYVNFIPGRGTPALVPLDVDISTLTPEKLNELVEKQIQEQRAKKKREKALKKQTKESDEPQDSNEGIGSSLKNMLLDKLQNLGARQRQIEEYQSQ